MKITKYNPIKQVKAFCVIRGRNTIATDSLFKWGVSTKTEFDRQDLEVFTIFPSKRKAMAWIAQLNILQRGHTTLSHQTRKSSFVQSAEN